MNRHAHDWLEKSQGQHSEEESEEENLRRDGSHLEDYPVEHELEHHALHVAPGPK